MVIPSELPAPEDDPVRYRDLFLALPLAQCLLDGTGRILVANPAADRLFGAMAGLLRGRAITELIDSAAGSALVRAMAGTGRGSPVTLQANARSIAGPIFAIEVAVVRVRAGPPALFGVLLRDLRESSRAGGPAGATSEYTVAELLMANRLRELV